MKTYSDFISVLEDASYSYGRFEYLLEQTSDCVIDNIPITLSMILRIKRFYEGTNKYNKTKISNMINNNIFNIHKVMNIIYEYEKVKINQECQHGI